MPILLEKIQICGCTEFRMNFDASKMSKYSHKTCGNYLLLIQPNHPNHISITSQTDFLFLCDIKGVLHLLPQKAPKLACFVLYLKIINTFLKHDICIL